MSKISDQEEVRILLEKAIKSTDQGKYQEAAGFFDELVEMMKEFDSELFNEVIARVTKSFEMQEVAEGELTALDKAKAVFADSQNIISNSIYAYIYHDMGVDSLNKEQNTEAFDHFVNAVSLLKSIFSDHQYMASILHNLNIAMVRVIEKKVDQYIKQDQFEEAANIIETMFKLLDKVSIRNDVDTRLLDVNLGICYNKVGKHELALKNLYKVISKIPADSELFKVLASFIVSSGYKIIESKIIESSNDSGGVLNTLLNIVSSLSQGSSEAQIVIDHAKSKLVIANQTSSSDTNFTVIDQAVVTEGTKTDEAAAEEVVVVAEEGQTSTQTTEATVVPEVAVVDQVVMTEETKTDEAAEEVVVVAEEGQTSTQTTEATVVPEVTVEQVISDVSTENPVLVGENPIEGSVNL